MNLLKNKNILIVGVANKHSIAAGIAQSMSENGANIALTYQNERLKNNVEKIGQDLDITTFLPCDVSSDTEIEETFKSLAKEWDGLDGVIHAVGFAPREELDGEFVDVTSREGFQVAHEISSYSFIGLAKEAKNMMKGRNGSLLTLSYLGSQMTLPNYNVMGLAKASLEASVRYLA
ncbi:MAG: enoyl-[acyl-carrier-protein] reductase FabI, partial [Rhodobiaceae bacterium]|nr:enoyl-[acyl-carrier-protein] reductase FabI [Rhodobiaceae bacterium]